MNFQNLNLTIRNLRKDRVYTLINVTGLAIAMATFLLIIQNVRFEKSYENFYEKADNIYRITLNLYKDGSYITTDCETHPAFAPLVKERIPEVKDYVRMQRLEKCEVTTAQHKAFLETNIYAVDSSMLSIFNQQFIAGDPDKALKGPMDAVLTETTAHKYFGNANPIGQTLSLSGQTMTIAGVVKDPPINTHLKFNLLLSLHFVEVLGYDLSYWGGNNNYTYLEMQPGTNLNAFNTKLTALSKSLPQLKDKLYSAEQLKEIHLYSRKSFEPEANGDSRIVQFLFIIAFLILVIGIINYINLTTARSAERMKEAGVRKLLGASQWALIKQFLLESFVINILAFALALLLIQLALPYYNTIVGNTSASGIYTDAKFWCSCGILFVANSLLSGIYPAYVLSSAKATSSIGRIFTSSREGSTLRKTLVVGQFAIASIVLVASLVVYKQLSFMRHQNLGMNLNQVLVVRAPDLLNDTTSASAFKSELQQLAGVSKVSIAGCVPGLGLEMLSTTSNVTRQGDSKKSSYNYYVYGFDEDFTNILDMKMVAGNNFKGHSSYGNEVVINEEASKVLGFSSPQEAVGQKLNFYDEHPTVIGVLKNFHQQSLKGALLPMIHHYLSDKANYFAIKITSGDMEKILASIEKKWDSQFRNHPFEYFFLDDTFNRQYQSDVRLGKIINIFSIFTIFITCLGLMGLAAYNVYRRTREIGIRKVLGSSVIAIIWLLTRDFIKLVLIAFIIATPVAWWIMNEWLQNFVYRTSIPWWVFLSTGGLLIIMAVCTIGLQSMKSAMMNPVKALRND
ncbi:ABC transporter permease [Chitinophaga silvatica]|nr:ABC transporter permease [Chitinophaga silvatica]